jgi:hypothetical protein
MPHVHSEKRQAAWHLMRRRHGRHEQTMQDTPQPASYHQAMINAEGAPTRTLTIVLPESDWRALRAAEPDAVAWLQARIRERLASPGPQSRTYTPPAAGATDTFWGDDEY